MKKSYVLDTYSVLVYLFGEKSAQEIEKILGDSKKKKTHLFMSAINFGEIYYRLIQEEGEELADKAIAAVSMWPLKMVPASSKMALKAGRIKAVYKLHYSDAFAVATALDRKAAVVTGDKEFKLVEELVDVHWLDN